jgi:hypothetical protein
MKKRIENVEQDKMLNQDRFGFSKEAPGRNASKPRISDPKNFDTGKDREISPHKGN